MTVLTHLVTATVIALAVAVYLLPVPIPYAIALCVTSFRKQLMPSRCIVLSR